MNLFSAVWLGVVQGLTEFLPVSSSAHLILVREFFGWDLGRLEVPFDVACHVGTLAAVVAFFWADLVAMLKALPQALGSSPGPEGRRIRLIVVGTIPIVLVGFLFASAIEAHTRAPVIAATTLFLGGVAFLLVERMGSHQLGEEGLSFGGVFLIGIAQAAALVPGVSRSGSTIATGMALGLRREVAARFTFLLSVPAIVAAAAKEGLELRKLALGRDDLVFFAVGMLTSAVVGYVTVKYFIRFLATHRLDVFAWYRLALGAAALAWLALR